MTHQAAETPAPRGWRISSLAAGVLFASNTLFALGGMAGYEHSVVFGLLYLLSAALTIPMVYLVTVAIRGRGAIPTIVGAAFLAVAAAGHAAEAVLVLTGRVQATGTAGPVLGLAEFVGLVAGMLGLAAGFWRAGISPIWPGLLFLVVLPISQTMPHGLAQQATRSALLVLVTGWLSYTLFLSQTSASSRRNDRH